MDGENAYWPLGVVSRQSVLMALLVALVGTAALPARAECLRRNPAAKPAVAVPAPPTILPPPGSPPPAVYGFPPTSYRSTWYNTHYWPRKTIHHGFYGDNWQWGYFPGY